MGLKGFFVRDNQTRPIIDSSGSTGMPSEKLTGKNNNSMKIQELESKNMNSFAKSKGLAVLSAGKKGAEKLHEAKKKSDENKRLQKEAQVAHDRHIEDMIDGILFNGKTTNNQKFEQLERLAIKLRDDKQLSERHATVINRNLKRLTEEKPHEKNGMTEQPKPKLIPKPAIPQRPSIPERPRPVEHSLNPSEREPNTTDSVSNDEDEPKSNLPKNLQAEIGAIIEREDKKN